jgi:hypothetical protein
MLLSMPDSSCHAQQYMWHSINDAGQPPGDYPHEQLDYRPFTGTGEPPPPKGCMLAACFTMFAIDPAVANSVTTAIMTLTATMPAHVTLRLLGLYTLQYIAEGKYTAVG